MTPPVFPTLNACLNLTAAILLYSGYKAIKAGKSDLHRKFMLGALCASMLFLASYITYHYLHGSTKYDGAGLMKVLYFFILLTHTPLATLMVPFIIAAVVFAIKGNFNAHTRITRWLFPVWMYVSVTGVLIYTMLYIL